jgi:hypothetical protein
MPFEHYGEGTWSFQGHPQHLCGPSRPGGAEEETKMHFASLWVTMTTSYSEVTHQSVYNMPFEHHGEGAWSFRGHAQHLCGPSRCGRAGHQGGGRALGHGAIVCDPCFIHKHRWVITQVQHTI